MNLQQINISHYGNVRLPSLSPPVIYSYEIAERVCDELLTSIQNSESTVVGPKVYGTDHSHQTDDYFRSSDWITVNKETVDKTAALMTSAVNRLCLTQINARSIYLAEPLQFLRYSAERNGHFSMHTDSAWIDGTGTFQYTSPQRILTSILYLNENFEGGELELGSVKTDDGKNLIVKPSTGCIVVFPSDLRFPHEAKVVTKGKRYCVVGWFNVAWRD